MSYGTAKLIDGKWVIDALPHVALRLKRVFGSIARNDEGMLRISDTIDTCRDLAWFCERYPLDVHPREYLERRSAEYLEREDLVAKLLAGQVEPAPFKLRFPPRDYQRIAAELALRSHGLLVADDLGLGKTVVAITLLTDPRTRPALVVTQKHLQRQWADEIATFAPHLETHILKQGTPYDYSRDGRSAQLAFIKPHPDVLITNYHKLDGWQETLAPVIRTVVYDEVQELRGGPSRAGKPIAKNIAAAYLSSRVDYRLGLSATPIYNYGGEIFHVLNALRPGSLGELDEFLTEHCSRGVEKPTLKDPPAFGSYLRDAGLMIRRTKADVGRELPELVKVPHQVDADEGVLKAIETPARELARLILGDKKLARGEAFNAGGKLDGLVRQATGVAKAPYVAEFVRMLAESGEKVVLFGWHHTVYKIWKEKLTSFGPALFTGDESEKQKHDAKKRFCSGDTPILIISLRSGAGLDGLQYSGCRTVVFGELDWSPAVLEQCIGRVRRDGQHESVLAYYMLADVGCDPIMADVLSLKKAQLEGLRDPSGPSTREVLDTTGTHIKKLAERYLRRAA